MIVGIFGIDGSGKTTQVRLLDDYLRSQGRIVEMVELLSPNRMLAHRIARAHGKRHAFDVFDVNALFLIGALDLVPQVQAWNIAKGTGLVMLLDKYTAAFKAHGAVRGMSDFRQADIVFASFPRPDVQIFLQIDPRLASERIQARDGAAHDNHEPEYLIAYAREYAKLVALDPAVKIIDASLPRDEVQRQIRAALPDHGRRPARQVAGPSTTAT